jgi:dTDP-4-dehydrorhamnose 3,5-epimerase
MPLSVDGPAASRQANEHHQNRIPGVLIIEPKTFVERRASFLELYRADCHATGGVGRRFVQDLSRSTKGILRGLHFQNPKPQGKLVTVLRGSVLDVVVDVRRGSPTFGRHMSIELDDTNRRQCWIPRGLAHGFVVRSDTADFFYKCDEFYSPADEIALRWNDPALAIDWDCEAPMLSPRDSAGGSLAELESELPQYEPV